MNRNTDLAKNLRQRMTDAERMLWKNLKAKNLGVKFKRQAPIGNYIVDFVCFEKKIIIEANGSQHLDSKTDEVRDKWFKDEGFLLLRFWNNDILQKTKDVIQKIINSFDKSPSLNLSHKGREVNMRRIPYE